MCENKLEKVNYFKLKGFEIGLARHPFDANRLFVTAVKDEQVIKLFAEHSDVAVEYVRKHK